MLLNIFDLNLESLQIIAEGVQRGDRVALSRAITLAESTLKEHQQLAHQLIQDLIHLTGKSKRIAITGVPGVGKSTFIESFGTLLTQKGFKVAVLAIDPSSTLSGGSILGDKTRMEELAKNPNAYIRPSATSGYLGGIASRTYEAMLLCEAAGFDVILIETVGVGQSETLVNEITDLFVFLQIPGGGDDLQGIKRGIMEMSDIIFVNKTDIFTEEKSKEVKVTMARSMQFLPEKKSGWKRKVYLGSGLMSKGLNEFWDGVQNYFQIINENGYLERNRVNQRNLRVKEYIKELVIRDVIELYSANSPQIESAETSPFLIAETWINKKLKKL